jgi:hypothetical protein
MEDMEQDRNPATQNGLVAAPTEASLRLQVTALLLGRRRDVRRDRSTREQSDVLQKIEAALEAYGNYFYPPEHR